MPKPVNHSRTQAILSHLIIILLISIAAAVLVKQKTYQKFQSEPIDNITAGSKRKPDNIMLSDGLFGSDFTPFSPIESYNADNLYEKIDGKADLYLNNGFVWLQCRRFSKTSDKDRWIEVYLYDMAEAENAFAVYSLQKRAESMPLDWAQFGDFTTDSVCLTAGKYYIEIFLSCENDAMASLAKNAARQLSSIVSAGKTVIPILALFPADGLVPDSFKFIKADAFSCSDLKDIFSAEYKINNSSITAFLTKTDTAETFTKYYRFLMDNGAKEQQHDIKLPDCKAAELFGSTELFFLTGGCFAGVRGQAPIQDLQKTAENLITKLASPP